MSTTLSSERLILRPWREDDLDALAQLCADPEVMAHFPATLDRAGSAALLGKLMAHQAEHGFTFWALQRREDAAFVGFTGLARVGFAAPFVPAVEIGWRLARSYWGQGYALEAMRSVVGHAATMGLRRLSARTHLGNLRSDALLEKLGFEEEGLLRGHVLRDGEHRDCRLFGLLL